MTRPCRDVSTVRWWRAGASGFVLARRGVGWWGAPRVGRAGAGAGTGTGAGAGAGAEARPGARDGQWQEQKQEQEQDREQGPHRSHTSVPVHTLHGQKAASAVNQTLGRVNNLKLWT